MSKSRYTLKLLMVAILICMIQSYISVESFPLLFAPLLPICYRYAKSVHPARKIDGIICGSVYGLYFAAIMYPASFLLPIPYHLCLLMSYSSAIFIYERDLFGIDHEKCANNYWFKIWLSLFFNPPLLLSWNIVSYFGGQLMAPLASIIDENICVGTLPCSQANVETLHSSPLNVRAVINLCDETIGPVLQYEKYNIQYLRLRTLDTTPPSVEKVRIGIQFIEKFIAWKNKHNNGCGRVFIHCKGGVGRSVTMALCWMISQGINAENGIKILQQKRKLASARVMTYNTVKYFSKQYSS
eukprot:209530_1